MWKSSRGSEGVHKGMVISSFFADGFKMIGDLESTCDIRIEGVIEGNITTSKKVVIGKTGHVIGNVRAANLCVMGEFVGEALVGELAKIEATGSVSGTLRSVHFQIEPGATVEANLGRLSAEHQNVGAMEPIDFNADRRSISSLHLSVG
ncbi:bactofilin family protein [Lunatimonas salinarum]|uniref:bactofilin family protein n=1 Tax=Lunatimonas salinarum TaxID=1774590 RepID=UPI001AE01487|nr:polymer-forming cytoskeletal protein [Lunatimonas salinarum]